MWVWERVRRGILLCFYEKDPFYLCKSNSRKTKKKKIFRRVGGIFGQNDDGMPRGKKRKKEEERKKKHKLMYEEGIDLAAKHDQKERMGCSEKEKRERLAFREY